MEKIKSIVEVVQYQIKSQKSKNDQKTDNTVNDKNFNRNGKKIILC